MKKKKIKKRKNSYLVFMTRRSKHLEDTKYKRQFPYLGIKEKNKSMIENEAGSKNVTRISPQHKFLSN